MKINNFLTNKKSSFIFALILCFLFFLAYSVLSIVRHEHYHSFGYDLGINNQLVWRYSTFQTPITTSDAFSEKTKLVTHVEVVYALLAPSYWVWSSPVMLLLLQAFLVCLSGLALFLLARKHSLSGLLSVALVFSYLMFYGVQNALWFDVHSAPFAAAFIAWFLYFLDAKRYKFAWLFLLLAITSKENIGVITFFIGVVYFIIRREKQILWMSLVSLVYVLFMYLVYFPYIVNIDYLYQNKAGLLSNLNPLSMIDSSEKRAALFYSFASVGFIPLFFPLLLLPILSDFATYFILASDLKASHGIFMHYRVTLAPLLIWATILTVSKYSKLNQRTMALSLIICAVIIQYSLHLPLSYLTKSWFWTKPSGVEHIESLRKHLQPNDAIVAQNNILSHISVRDKIYTLYPETKTFEKNSPCGQGTCDWFRWEGKPTVLFIDTSNEWDARHLLTDRANFVAGISNMERAGVIKKKHQSGSAVIYEITRSPH